MPFRHKAQFYFMALCLFIEIITIITYHPSDFNVYFPFFVHVLPNVKHAAILRAFCSPFLKTALDIFLQR